MSAQSMAQAARDYCERGFALVPIPPRSKAPKGDGWNHPEQCLTKPDEAAHYYRENPQNNAGILHSASRTCSLDMDAPKHALAVLAHFGIDAEGLRATCPTVQGKPGRWRTLFRVPEGAELSAHKLSWPDPDDTCKQDNRITIFELRAGAVQDVLPPSVHPGTQAPYSWLTPLPEAGELPVLPAELLAIWQNWPQFKQEAEQLCPWRPQETRIDAPKPKARPEGTPSVIGAYNAAHAVTELLERHGYQRRGKKYLAPNSSSGYLGVTILDGGRCFSHHGSDVLGDGYAHDAFDLFCIFEHGGDFSKAVKAAALVFGIKPDATGGGQEGAKGAGANGANGARNGADEYAREVQLFRGSEIQIRPIAWLWDGWLAEGKVHILGGAPGAGKTTIALALAATHTSGGRWPDGSAARVGNVVIWSGEDDAADTLMQRLALAGADLSRIYVVADVHEGDERRSFDPAKDMEPLRRKLAEVGDVRLLIVDPIVSAIAGDSHKNAEVRRGLQPLADLAASLPCALLGITHFSKGTGGRDPVERITGSVAFGAVARIVLVAAKHQEEGDDGRDLRLLCRAKSNIGPDDGGFQYELHQDELGTHPGVLASRIKWGEAVTGAARELLATADASGDDGEGGALVDAKRFLAGLLADGPKPSTTIKADADGAGYSVATIRRAQKALGIEARKEGMKGPWVWAMPKQEATENAKVLKNNEDAQQKKVGTFEEVEHLRDDDADSVEVEI